MQGGQGQGNGLECPVEWWVAGRTGTEPKGGRPALGAISCTNCPPRRRQDSVGLHMRRMRHKVEILAPKRDIYEKIFAANCKRLGFNACPDAIDFLYERYYERGRSPRASDCRDLLEIVQSICRYRKQPIHLTRDLIAEAASSFIAEF